ncbi:MAG: hypothetical protein CMN55_01955 [Sneathiella sp.]|jgi:TRAP-type C4-dicarboxylate transport system permease small subunit|uniref:TRAP transporter small permease n=1 Tax=Sneathiella sp. TaxID=1964365 RepID=UPI000C3E8B1A|nr:TRAP transporter small permease [Sneathiella sp.]MAL77867.1 hypothetical protein [Sneathiella sp.]|tara:strand:+ start:2493 stop:3017 length:525 start_codon:yes stop_codon:yes gene_type:complete
MKNGYGNLLWSALIISGLCMFLMLSVSTADVLAYLLIGRPFPGANEIVEIALAVCVAMAIVYAHYSRSHVQVDIISERFSPSLQRIMKIMTFALSTLCTGFLAYGSWLLALTSLQEKETAITLHSFPIYPWKLLFAIGLTLAAIEVFRQFILACLGRPHWLGGRMKPSMDEGES